MFVVESYAAVRRFVFVEGHSRREASRVFGLSRETVGKMCRFSLPPGYTRTAPVDKPKLGGLLAVIDEILMTDQAGPVKQRHTAKRIFERLRDEHSFAGGYTIVKDYVRLSRSRGRETFVPLSHPPGHAQVDFGEAVAIIEQNQGRTGAYTCGGCFMGVTDECVNQLMTKDDIIRCANCTRILVLGSTQE